MTSQVIKISQKTYSENISFWAEIDQKGSWSIEIMCSKELVQFCMEKILHGPLFLSLRNVSHFDSLLHCKLKISRFFPRWELQIWHLLFAFHQWLRQIQAFTTLLLPIMDKMGSGIFVCFRKRAFLMDVWCGLGINSKVDAWSQNDILDAFICPPFS